MLRDIIVGMLAAILVTACTEERSKIRIPVMDDSVQTDFAVILETVEKDTTTYLIGVNVIESMAGSKEVLHSQLYVDSFPCDINEVRIRQFSMYPNDEQHWVLNVPDSMNRLGFVIYRGSSESMRLYEIPSLRYGMMPNAKKQYAIALQGAHGYYYHGFSEGRVTSADRFQPIHVFITIPDDEPVQHVRDYRDHNRRLFNEFDL